MNLRVFPRDSKTKDKDKRPKTQDQILYARLHEARSEAGIHSPKCRSHFCREELSLDHDARHLASDRRQPRWPVSLLQIERRTPFSDSGQLFRARCRTTRTAL